MDLLFDGETFWKNRFGIAFEGFIIPLEPNVYTKPATPLIRNVSIGIIVGYVQHAGGGWTGDLLVVDQEDIDSADFKSEED